MSDFNLISLQGRTCSNAEPNINLCLDFRLKNFTEPNLQFNRDKWAVRCTFTISVVIFSVSIPTHVEYYPHLMHMANGFSADFAISPGYRHFRQVIARVAIS